ncbi:MAG: hypothetical protein LQ350_003547 [Teloschistes chrysophthalmus]|nr:MAG: hypothetical protein LQ350_003547 [Niorma chrysophthalma]
MLPFVPAYLRMLRTQTMRAIRGLKRLAEKLDVAVESHPYCKYCKLVYIWLNLGYPFLLMQRGFALAFQMDVSDIVPGYKIALMVIQVLVWCDLDRLVVLEVNTDVVVERKTAKSVRVSEELLKARKELVKQSEELVRILRTAGVGPKEIYQLWMKRMERGEKPR